MTTYKELLQQREALERQISEARQRENAQALAQVRALVADFELTPEDVFPTGKTRGPKAAADKSGGKTKVAPKYRNPATGDTWTGRGKPPRWIQDQDRAQFLIA
ncbi:histone [Rhodoferax koreense]|uniref:Histone n=1 Tax=Rhodoferax koreensis TaxID=1842727 RepID=A0A1P8JSK2_9BURK|nr:H-NS histone family protein [Rhodoferax koreense]APW36708.1 histone [Rhodoferax koreense]